MDIYQSKICIYEYIFTHSAYIVCVTWYICSYIATDKQARVTMVATTQNYNKQDVKNKHKHLKSALWEFFPFVKPRYCRLGIWRYGGHNSYGNTPVITISAWLSSTETGLIRYYIVGNTRILDWVLKLDWITLKIQNATLTNYNFLLRKPVVLILLPFIFITFD